MANYSTDQRFVFPVLDGDAANTLGVSADFPDSTIHSDTTPTQLTSGNSYVARNAVLSLERMNSQHANGTDLAYDVRDSTIYINESGDNTEGQLGTNVFENVSFIRNGTGGSRSGVGRFILTDRDNANHTYRNCNLVANNSASSLVFFCAGLNLDNLVFENVSFDGAAVAELINGFPGDRTSWSGAGSTAQSPAGYTYVVRVTQHDPNGQIDSNDDNNVQTGGGFPLHFYTMMTQNDFSASTDGNDALLTTSECAFMINRRAAVWIVNPIFGGRTLPITNHINNTSLQQPSEIRQFIGWRPIGRDSQTNAHVADYTLLTPTNAAGTRRLVQLPAGFTYDGNTVPTPITTEVTINDANYRGLWVESIINTYTVAQTGTQSTIQENVLNGNNLAWSFTHDVEHSFGIPTFAVTTRNGETRNILGSNANAFIGFEEDSRTGAPLAEYLNGHTSVATAPDRTTEVDNIGDIFPALRSDWYTRRVQGAFTATGTGGNNITFPNQAIIGNGLITTAQTNGTSIINVAATINANDTINSLTFDDTTIASSLTGVALPPLTLNGAGTLNVDGTTFGLSTTLGIAQMTNVRANQFALALNFTTTHILDIASDQGNFTIPNIQGIAPGSVIELRKSSGDNIVITVPANLNLDDPDTSNLSGYSAGSGVRLESEAPDAANYVFTSGELAGRFAVRNVTKDVELLAPIDVPSNSPITVEVANTDTARIEVGDRINLYYKPTNLQARGYLTTVLEYNVVAITADTPIVASVNIIADVLYPTDTDGNILVYTGASANTTVDPDDGTRIRVTLTGATAAGTNLTGGRSEALLLGQMDDLQYFEQMVDNERTVDFILPEVSSTTVENVTLASSSGTQQQALQAVGGGTLAILDLATYAGVPSVTIVPNPAGLSVDGATLACRSAIQSENLATAGLVGGLY